MLYRLPLIFPPSYFPPHISLFILILTRKNKNPHIAPSHTPLLLFYPLSYIPPLSYDPPIEPLCLRWCAPPPITYGTLLDGPLLLDATTHPLNVAGTYTYSITNPFYGVDLMGLGLGLESATEPGLGLAQGPGLGIAQRLRLGQGPAPGPGLASIDTDSPMLLLQTVTVNEAGARTSVVDGRGRGVYYSAGGHQMKCVFVPAAGGIYARGGSDGWVEKTVSLWVNRRKTIVKWGCPPPPLQRGMSPCDINLLSPCDINLLSPWDMTSPMYFRTPYMLQIPWIDRTYIPVYVPNQP